MFYNLGKEIGFTPKGAVWNIVRPNVEFSSVSIVDSMIYVVALALGFALTLAAKKIGLFDNVHPIILNFLIVLLAVFLVTQTIFWIILIIALVVSVFFFTQTHKILR